VKISKVELLLILGAALNASAELANLLPVEISGKLTASLLALWALVRFALRFVQASPASVKEIEALREELHGRVGEITAKRAQPASPKQ
jgi:membrane protein implicated in regulation of membrane protease activity